LKPKLKVTGGIGLNGAIASLKYFLHRPQFILEVNELTAEPKDKLNYDNNLAVLPVFLYPLSHSTHSPTDAHSTHSTHSTDAHFTHCPTDASVPQLTTPPPSQRIPDEQQSKDTAAAAAVEKAVERAEGSKTSSKKKFTHFQTLHSPHGSSATLNLTFKSLSLLSSHRNASSTSYAASSTSSSTSYAASSTSSSTSSTSYASSSSSSECAISYICHTPDIPGKFNAAKALALGLKRGPKYGLLCKGQTVTTDEGVVIRPSDCIGAPQRGAVFIVIECPSIAHLASLLQREQFKEYMQHGTYEKDLAFIIHFTPLNVLSAAEYTQWMHAFRDTVQVQVHYTLHS
jgi:hypothetical protein